MGQATLMYGIGATKAGTSWLYRYLSMRPDCRMPPMKELHYFQMLEDQSFEAGHKRLARARFLMAERKAVHGANKKWYFARRERLLDEWEAVLNDAGSDPMTYVQYMNGVGKDRLLTGDISPSYSLLSPTVLRLMAGIAPVTRFVYLLRDPVERLWSNLKMDAARISKSPERIEPNLRKLVQVAVSKESNDAVARSDYQGALTRLDSGVPGTNLWTGFFETLFSDESIENLCRFLGLPFVPARNEKKVHAGAPLKMNDETRSVLQRLLAPQYAFVEDRFGDLPGAWKQNMVRV